MKETETIKGQKIVIAECTHYWIIDGRDVGVCKYWGGEELREGAEGMGI